MKVKSGFLMYLFIFLGLIVGACLIMVAIMMFSPGTSIFGLQYYSENTVTTYSKTDGYFDEFENYDYITINSLSKDKDGNTLGYGYYNVEIRPGYRDAAVSNVVVSNQITGLVKSSDNLECSINFNAYQIDGKNYLTISITQVNTFLASKNCKIALNIPAEQNMSNTIFTINTKNGDIDMGGTLGKDNELSPLNISAFKVATETGNIVIKEKTTAPNYVDAKTTSGKISFFADSFNTKEVALETTTGKILLPNSLTTPSLTLTTNSGTIDGGDINGNLTLNSEMGIVRLNNISGNLTGTEKLNGTDIKLLSIGGELGIPNARNVKLEVGKVDGFININTQGGIVTIGKNNSGILSRANITTDSGTIKVYISGDELVNLQTKSGKVTAYFEVFNSNKNITTESGNIDIYLNQNTSLNLICETKNETILNWEETKVKNDIVYREIRGSSIFDNSILKIKSNTGKINVVREVDLVFE